MLNFHKEHRNLALTAFIVFAALSTLIAIVPALQMQAVEPLSTMPAMTPEEVKGLQVYIREGCVACHTQQVRNIEMDKVWGSRPSIPEDYVYSKARMDIWRQSPSTLGSERTGPDLTNIGKRQPSEDWHLLHLFNPRSVVSASVMPSYKWLFTEKAESEIGDDDRTISVPEDFYNRKGYKVVAKEDALHLVAYLQSLKQADLPEDKDEEEFIPSTAKSESADKGGSGSSSGSAPAGLDGGRLYAQTCAVCHQDNGQGVTGAFPPLAGSDIVNDEDHEKLISIIINGYSELQGYGPMPPFGDQLSDEEIAAIATHERSSWGNDAPAVSEEDVKKIREFLLSNE